MNKNDEDQWLVRKMFNIFGNKGKKGHGLRVFNPPSIDESQTVDESQTPTSKPFLTPPPGLGPRPTPPPPGLEPLSGPATLSVLPRKGISPLPNADSSSTLDNASEEAALKTEAKRKKPIRLGDDNIKPVKPADGIMTADYQDINIKTFDLDSVDSKELLSKLNQGITEEKNQFGLLDKPVNLQSSKNSNLTTTICHTCTGDSDDLKVKHQIIYSDNPNKGGNFINDPSLYVATTKELLKGMKGANNCEKFLDLVNNSNSNSKVYSDVDFKFEGKMNLITLLSQISAFTQGVPDAELNKMHFNTQNLVVAPVTDKNELKEAQELLIILKNVDLISEASESFTKIINELGGSSDKKRFRPWSRH